MAPEAGVDQVDDGRRTIEWQMAVGVGETEYGLMLIPTPEGVGTDVAQGINPMDVCHLTT